jgi:hypothetical protein
MGQNYDKCDDGIVTDIAVRCRLSWPASSGRIVNRSWGCVLSLLPHVFLPMQQAWPSRLFSNISKECWRLAARKAWILLEMSESPRSSYLNSRASSRWQTTLCVNSGLELLGNSGGRTVECNDKLISVLDQQQWWMVDPYPPIVNKSCCEKPTINRHIHHSIDKQCKQMPMQEGFEPW